MSDDELRRECEEWIIGNSPYIPPEEELGCVDSLVALIKQQRAAVCLTVEESILDEERKPLMGPLSTRSKSYNEAIRRAAELCREQRAKELKP